MGKIGIVELPSGWKWQNDSDSVQMRSFEIKLGDTINPISEDGANLPVQRYTAFCQTSDSDALRLMDELREMFKNPDINYPLLLDADEEIYFYLQNFNYSRVEGYKNFWRMDLTVLRVGEPSVEKITYYSTPRGKKNNDWGI